MSTSLSQVPVVSRRRGGVVAAAIAVLCGVAGALPWSAASPVLLRVLSVPVLTVGVISALVTWGLLRSVGVDVAEARVDAAVQAGLGAAGIAACDCGHEHDPDELHVTDSPCESADVCTHDCATCVLQRR